MVAARRIHPALLALAAAFALVATVDAAPPPALSLSSCATACVKLEDCEASETKCMCKGAKGKLLNNVAVCMYYKCPDEIRSFTPSFLAPLASACREAGSKIPQARVDEAADTAELFGDKLPTSTSSTTAKAAGPATTSTRGTPKTPVPVTSSSKTTTTTTTAPVVATTSSQPAQTTVSTSTSSVGNDDDDDDTTTSSTTTEESAATTATTTTDRGLVTSTTSATRAEGQSSTSTKSSGRYKATDAGPFISTPQNAGVRSTGSWVLAGLPLALAVVLTR